MVHLKSTSSRVLMQVQRCEPSTTSQAVCLWGQRRPQDSVPSSSVYLSSLAGALIPSHGFKFHLPFSVFTPVFLLGSRLLTISTWIPLRLRSPSISNTDSRILSLPIPPHPVYQVSIDSTFHQVAQAFTYSHLPLIFFSPTLHLTHQKKNFGFIIDLGSPSDYVF